MLQIAILLFLLQNTFGLYLKSGPVVLLTQADFGKRVVNDDGVWLVEFFAPWCGHCKTLVPEWEKAAKALKGVVNVAAVDATQDQSLASQYSVQGFPTILIFGADKSKPDKYQNARTAEAITDAGLKAAQSVVKQRLTGKKAGSGEKSSSPSDVVELTSSNFEQEVLKSTEPWLVEFFAPWCGHCKNLAPEWEKAATELKGSVKLGAVDVTQHQELGQKYDVRGYPTIKFFPPGEKSAPLDYEGGRTATTIVEWGLTKLDEYGGGPQAVEAVSDAVLKEFCLHKKICVVAVLPHIMDTGAKGRQEYLDTIVEVAKKTRSKPMAFVWMQGGAQTKFEEALGVSFNYPTMAAISVAKMRYATHRGAFAVDALSTFLNGVWSGRQRTSELKALPALINVEPWDGNDYKAPAEDEEE